MVIKGEVSSSKIKCRIAADSCRRLNHGSRKAGRINTDEDGNDTNFAKLHEWRRAKRGKFNRSKLRKRRGRESAGL